MSVRQQIDWLLDHRQHLTKAELAKVRRVELYLPCVEPLEREIKALEHLMSEVAAREKEANDVRL
ncbi:hypothetical protein D3C87_2181580 [compost metagenome]